ncbi:MAG: hypothetical protein CFE21_06000 [Bacteroidetes bacterium B1(2017)]|nr:MAG: hypothetical protein CFE21_06000 [Bacteroidetes bacterium B1(2017)]
MKINNNSIGMKKTKSSHLMQMATAAGLITMLESFGSSFNPSNANISLQALKDNLALNQQLVLDINDAKTKLATHQLSKNEMLLGINTRVRQMLFILGSLGLNPATLDRVRVISKNFSQRTVKVKEPASADPIKSNANPGEQPTESSSQLIKSSNSAYKFAERKINWFKELVSFISSLPSYAPNEPTLTVTALNAYVLELEQELEAWNKESQNLHLLRLKREQQLKSETDGMVTLFRQAKSYVKGIYGPGSLQSNEMIKFSFKR